jgi:hypothetical protein
VRSLKINKYAKSLLLIVVVFLLTFAAKERRRWPPEPKLFVKEGSSLLMLEKGEYDDFQHLRPFWKIFVPDWFGKIVESHVACMLSGNCYQELCEKDFDHGHMLLRKNAKATYNSVDDFFGDVVMILYHTAERNKRWHIERKKNQPVKKRAPRSLLGFKNGMVRSARDLVELNQIMDIQYEESGTIHTPQLLENFGLSESETKVGFEMMGKQIIPRLTLSIKPYAEGRYKAGKQRFDVYIRCQEAN